MQDDQGNGEGQLPADSEPDFPGAGGADEQHVPAPEQARDDLAGSGSGAPEESFGRFASPTPDLSQPASAAGQPGFSADQPGFSADQPGFGPDQPGFSADQPGFSAGQTAPGMGQPGLYGQAASGQAASGQAGYGQAGYGQQDFPPYGSYGGYGYGPQPGSRARRRRAVLTYLTVAVVAAAVGAGLTGFALRSNQGSVPTASGSSPRAVNPGGGGFFPNTGGRGVSGASEHAAVNAVRPELVDISSNLRYQGSQAAATGMVISSNGLVLTNNHVIDGTTQLYATLLSNGHKYQARWLGYDATDDVAVIKLIGAHNLPTVPLGDSGQVKVGDQVIAIGNAYGADRNPAYVGAITGLKRTITASDSGASTKETLHNMLETNAGIVEGDSGGPLVSAAGKVIGMDTAAATSGVGATAPSVGFAIPIDRALRIAHQIISGQSSPTVQIGSSGFMGVLVPAGAASQSTSPKQQRQQQLNEDQGATGIPAPNGPVSCLPTDIGAGVPSKVAPAASGALIIGVLCGTPADNASIVAGDVITNVGGQAVTSPHQLTSVMLRFKPGMSVKVAWVDIHGQKHDAKLPLITAPPH